MGVLRFDGADWVRFSTLASALNQTSNGAYTAAVLLKQAADSGLQAYTYLCSAGSITEAGIGRGSTGLLISDISGIGTSTSVLDVAGTTETRIVAMTKEAGSAAPTYYMYTRGTTTWSTPDAGDLSLSEQSAATILEIGTWEGGGDLANAWIGLVAWWEGAMSQANIETLDDNWRTSDWWNNAHGNPTCLIEGNVAAASLVDIAGNATGLSVTGTPTLDSGETLSSFNFDGTGTPAAQRVMAESFQAIPFF